MAKVMQGNQNAKFQRAKVIVVLVFPFLSAEAEY